MALDAKILCLRIIEAFESVPYPGEEHLVLEDTADTLEVERIENVLRGRHWRDISFETLSEISSALSFLSPGGYRFYLPAFMVFSVAAFDQANPIPHEVVHSLTLPELSDLQQTRELADLNPEVQPFSAEEWQSILVTLEQSYRSGVPKQVFFDRMSGFNVMQKQVIREFLEYLRDSYRDEFPNGEPQRAIERYWINDDRPNNPSPPDQS